MILDKGRGLAVSAAWLDEGASREKRPAQESRIGEIAERQPRRMGASIVKSVTLDRCDPGRR